MNSFKRALKQSQQNPKYVFSVFAMAFVYSGVRIILALFIKNGLLNIVAPLLTDALYALSSMMLAVNISEDQAFSWKPLSRLPRALPAALFGLIPVLPSLFTLWFYNTLSVSVANSTAIRAFLIIFFLVSELVAFYLTGLCMPLYLALRAKNHPHALSRALTLFAHPIHLIKSSLVTNWVLGIIRVVLLRIAAFFCDAQIYAEYAVVLLLAPLTALLALAYCDAACTEKPHIKPDHQVMEELP